jgi:hypothetical protein
MDFSLVDDLRRARCGADRSASEATLSCLEDCFGFYGELALPVQEILNELVLWLGDTNDQDMTREIINAMQSLTHHSAFKRVDTSAFLDMHNQFQGEVELIAFLNIIGYNLNPRIMPILEEHALSVVSSIRAAAKEAIAQQKHMRTRVSPLG